MSSIYESILENDPDKLLQLLNKNYSLECPKDKNESCFQVAIKEASWHQDYSVITTLIRHLRTREKMLIACLQYRIVQKNSLSRMAYKYLFLGCKYNLPELVSFILKSIKIEYSIFQIRDKCLDVCKNNDCFRLFMEHSNTWEMTLIYYVDSFLLPQSNNFIEHPKRDYLYRTLYSACFSRSLPLLQYLTDKFIIDLNYSPYPNITYFDLVSGTPLYDILLDYWYQITSNKIYRLNHVNKRKFVSPPLLSSKAYCERQLLEQFDCDTLVI